MSVLAVMLLAFGAVLVVNVALGFYAGHVEARQRERLRADNQNRWDRLAAEWKLYHKARKAGHTRIACRHAIAADAIQREIDAIIDARLAAINSPSA